MYDDSSRMLISYLIVTMLHVSKMLHDPDSLTILPISERIYLSCLYVTYIQ